MGKAHKCRKKGIIVDFDEKIGRIIGLKDNLLRTEEELITSQGTFAGALTSSTGKVTFVST